MRNRERGIGNLPFIAVLVLFVVALALFFMKQDEADTERGKKLALAKTNADQTEEIVRLKDAYNTYKEVVGVMDASLDLKGEGAAGVPTTATIKKRLRAYIAKVTADVTKAGEATFITRNYKLVDGHQKSDTGDTSTVKLYLSTMAPDAATFRGVLDPLEAAMRSAAKIAMENNRQFEQEKAKYDTELTKLRDANKDAETKYVADVKAKTQAAEGWRGDLKKARDNNGQLTQKLDNMETDFSQQKDAWGKAKRKLERSLSAWQDRATNEKIKNAIALAEDPRDGGVIRVSDTLGTVWINLGTRHKLSRGTKFTVWRPGKGNVRQNIAQVEVINVYRTSAETRIIRRLSSRVHPTKGMNVSNPFYDPKRTLKIYIYGDLRNYPTDIAARRLAASGAVVSRSLDDTVNVIVLGEPPRSGDEEEVDDAESAAAAEKKAAMDRSRRLTVVMEKAVAIGAIVVTEDVLASFIDY